MNTCTKIFFNSLINQLLGTGRVLKLVQMRTGLKEIRKFIFPTRQNSFALHHQHHP